MILVRILSLDTLQLFNLDLSRTSVLANLHSIHRLRISAEYIYLIPNACRQHLGNQFDAGLEKHHCIVLGIVYLYLLELSHVIRPACDIYFVVYRNGDCRMATYVQRPYFAPSVCLQIELLALPETLLLLHRLTTKHVYLVFVDADGEFVSSRRHLGLLDTVVGSGVIDIGRSGGLFIELGYPSTDEVFSRLNQNAPHVTSQSKAHWNCSFGYDRVSEVYIQDEGAGVVREYQRPSVA